MARKSAVWIPLDVNFMDDPKVLKAGEQAGWFYLAMCLACKRIGTDGVLEGIQLARLGVVGWQKRLARLVDHELVIEVGPDAYAIASWLEHNDSVEDIEEKRRKDRLRKARGTGSGREEGAA